MSGKRQEMAQEKDEQAQTQEIAQEDETPEKEQVMTCYYRVSYKFGKDRWRMWTG
jgi:hypothetical protein